MRPTKLTKNILIIFSILAVILLSNFLLDRDNVYSSNKEISNKMEHSANPGVDIITEVTEESIYNMSIHYPEFNTESLNKEISEYISISKNEFLTEVNRKNEYLKDVPASLYISFDIYPFAKDMYSIVLNNESYVTGVNGLQSSKVFLVDIQNKRFIQQTEILNDNEEIRKKIYQLLLNDFESTGKYSPFLFNELLKEWVEDENNKFTNMYLTDNSIVFKFNKYEVSAGAAGSPEISIALNKMSNLITDEWKKILNLENEVKERPKLTEKSEPSDESESKKDLEDNTPLGKKRVALTFDDGPHPTNTLAILHLLDEYNAKATFFMLGNRVDFYPGIAQDIAKRGHELGNHTWNHKDITSLGKAEIIQEIEMTNEVIQNATGEQPTVFRPPYGAINDPVLDILGLPTVLWTIDTLDWKSHNPNKVLSIVKENISDGSVILMHDIHESSVEAVELLLEFLEEEGYEFVTVSELYSDE